MNLTQLFQRRKDFQAELIRPLNKQRLDMLRELAKGGEIDETTVFRILDELGISEAQLAADVTTQQSRYQWAEERAICQTATSTAARLQSEKDALNAEFERFMASYQPKVDAVNVGLQAANLNQLQFSSAEARLMGSVLDTELIERQEELDTRKRENGLKIRSLDSQISKLQSVVTLARLAIEQLQREQEADTIPTTPQGEHYQALSHAEKLKAAKNHYAESQRRLAELQNAYDESRSTMRLLDREQAELDQLKLLP